MYDVCVIGGGPAGMFSAYYASSRSLKTILLEAEEVQGGRMNYYLSMPLFDIPGQFAIETGVLLQNFILQLEKSNAEVSLGTKVLKVEKAADTFFVSTSRGQIEAKTIIVATGNGVIKTKKLERINVSSEAIENIRYQFSDSDVSMNDTVAIIGHTPTAIDWAIQVATKGIRVKIYETKQLNLQRILVEQVKHLRVEVLRFNDVKGITYEHNHFRIDEAQYSKVYCHIGTRKESIQVLPKPIHIGSGKTSVAGMFLAGDVRVEQGKLKLIHGATHDAMQAVNEANQYVNPQDYYQPIVSTHHPIFKDWSK